MPVTLSVSQIRNALSMAGAASVSGGGLATTALLGQWFHDGMASLVSRDGAAELYRELEQSEADQAVWRSVVVQWVYDRVVGPRLTRSRASLRESSAQVMEFWRAMQAGCHWYTDLLWGLGRASRSGRRNPGASWQLLADCFESEVALECEFRESGWSDSVRLVGIADQVCRVGSEGAWCVLEFKTGRTSPESDLGQACLYHLILSQLSAMPGKGEIGSALALIRFSPEPQELLFTSDQLLEVRARLLALIGQLGGVAGTLGDLPADKGGVIGRTGTSRVSGRESPGADAVVEDLPQRIMAAFREYGVDVTLGSEVQAGPAFLRFTIIPGVGTKVAAIERRAAELQIRLGLTAEPFISRDQGRVVMDIQRPDRQMVYFEQIRDLLPVSNVREGNARIPVGVDFSGELVFADLSQPEHCHLLVAGTTGSGKSEWLRLALAGLIVTNTPETLRLVVIDPKRNAFHALQGSPFLWCPVVFPDEQSASEVLEALCVEMESRYRQLDGADTIAQAAVRAGIALPRIVCVCDEYRDLISRSRAERLRIEGQISRLGAKARAAGIHLILATQEASRETIRGPLDANIPARVGLKVGRALESRMLLGGPGAEKLLGYGDLLFKDTQPLRRLQAPLLTEADRAAIFGGI